MSGIYIKGMEMPKHCWSCCFHDEVDDCVILKESCMTVWGEQKRLSDCPLISVPDHGRLVDADALVTELEKFCKDSWVYNTVSHIKTIIQADKDGTE